MSELEATMVKWLDASDGREVSMAPYQTGGKTEVSEAIYWTDVHGREWRIEVRENMQMLRGGLQNWTGVYAQVADPRCVQREAVRGFLHHYQAPEDLAVLWSQIHEDLNNVAFSGDSCL